MINDIVATQSTHKHARRAILCVFALQETVCWPCEDMTARCYQIYGSATGSTALRQPVVMCGVRESWTADRCTVVLVKDTLVSVYAPEVFMDEVKKMLTEGRPRGATQFYFAGSLKIQMGSMTSARTRGCKHLHHCLKKAMWIGIMEFFDGFATSTWLHTQDNNGAKGTR